MRLDRLAALAAAVDRPQGRSLVRAAACRWGLDADPARYVRTSATCVYAVGGGYLRLLPVADRPPEDVRVAAAAAAALEREGAPVVAPRPSTAGRLVEVVPSRVPGVGEASAMIVDAAPGEACDLDDLTGPDIERWGRAGLDRTDEQALPLVQRLTAALTYGRLRRALTPAPTREPEPDWMVTLRGRLARTAECLRAALTSEDGRE